MAEQILRIKPADVVKLIKQGEMEVVSPTIPASPDRPIPYTRMVERAMDILGTDFLGVEAIEKMTDKLKTVGVNVEFNLGSIPDLPYTEEDLQLAKQNGEILVLRAGTMTEGTQRPINIINFRKLFKKDPNGVLETPFYTFRKDANDWYKNEDFAKKNVEIQPGWALVKKDLLEDSRNKNWNQQNDVLKAYGEELVQTGATNIDVRRRTAMEAVWDAMLYYTNTGEHLLERDWDWTSSRTSGGYLVRVGVFDSNGLYVNGWNPEHSRSNVGVCPSR